MPDEKVGIKAGITAKLEKRDDAGKVVKTTFFFPDLGVSVEAKTKMKLENLRRRKPKKLVSSFVIY